MSQSASLTKALRAVEKVLDTDTGDLKELAKIAGLDPKKLYFRADLSGVDLRNIDIDFLLPLETSYEGAELTNQQRQAFRRHSRKQSSQRVRKSIVDLRIFVITQFIRDFEVHDVDYYAPISGAILTSSLLKNLLLYPMAENTQKFELVNADYINSVLSELVTWVNDENYVFFENLFTLFGKILLPIDQETRRLIKTHYYPIFTERTGTLIAKMQPTFLLDDFWMSTHGKSNVVIQALDIAAHRNVNVHAIEMNIAGLGWKELLSVFSLIPFDCDTDQAERLSAHLVNLDWPANFTLEILDSETHPKVRNAIFRQLLAQGKQERVVEVILWLDDNRGAAGALSLENAFTHIHNFRVGLFVAEEMLSNIAPNQFAAILASLRALASKSKERAELSRLEQRYHDRAMGRWDLTSPK